MDEIVEQTDIQMIARGDMATETDFTEPPIMQRNLLNYVTNIINQQLQQHKC